MGWNDVTQPYGFGGEIPLHDPQQLANLAAMGAVNLQRGGQGGWQAQWRNEFDPWAYQRLVAERQEAMDKRRQVVERARATAVKMPAHRPNWSGGQPGGQGTPSPSRSMWDYQWDFGGQMPVGNQQLMDLLTHRGLVNRFDMDGVTGYAWSPRGTDSTLGLIQRAMGGE